MRRSIPFAVLVGTAIVVVMTGAPGTASGQGSPAPSATASPGPSVSAPASLAPSQAPSATAVSDPCALWTADEVSAALGGGAFTIQPASSGAPICFYTGSKKAGDLTQGMGAGFLFGDPASEPPFEMIRQSFPDREVLDIGGLQAIQGTTYPGSGKAKGWSMTALYVFPDPMTMLQLEAAAPKGVKVEAALLGLVELAAARIATISPPVASPSPATSPVTSNAPSASVEPRTGLPALFPVQIAGAPVEIEVDLTGSQFLDQIVNSRPMEQRVTKALKQRKRGVGDLSFAIGASRAGSVIAAFQVKGGAIKPFVNVLLESLAMERTGQAVRVEDLGGKNAFAVMGGFLIGGSGYAYPKDDVLWLIFPTPAEQTEVFEQLP